jgi:hypothetical protein
MDCCIGSRVIKKNKNLAVLGHRPARLLQLPVQGFYSFGFGVGDLAVLLGRFARFLQLECVALDGFGC